MNEPSQAPAGPKLSPAGSIHDDYSAGDLQRADAEFSRGFSHRQISIRRRRMCRRSAGLSRVSAASA